MKKSSIALLISASAVLALLGGYAFAQVYSGTPNPIAFVCAYNSGGPPPPVAGSFYFIQCDVNGKIIVQ